MIIQKLESGFATEAFFCGVDALDCYLRKQARQDARRNVSSIGSSGASWPSGSSPGISGKAYRFIASSGRLETQLRQWDSLDVFSGGS